MGMTRYLDPEMGSSKPLARLPLFDDSDSCGTLEGQGDSQHRGMGRTAAPVTGTAPVHGGGTLRTSGNQAPPAGIKFAGERADSPLPASYPGLAARTAMTCPAIQVSCDGSFGNGEVAPRGGSIPHTGLGGQEVRFLPIAGIHATARSTDPDTSKAAAEAFTEQRLTEIQGAVLAPFAIRRRALELEGFHLLRVIPGEPDHACHNCINELNDALVCQVCQAKYEEVSS